ncbi:MAG: CAP domain-containing protein [Candidatus Gottesmanbacteria bacterium]|nr:CAP domain-containing protein [Candidatus Gottesmanbacteria bacterium]
MKRPISLKLPILLTLAAILLAFGALGVLVYEVKGDIQYVFSSAVLPEPPSSTTSVDVKQMFALINQARQENNLPPFVESHDLSYVAYLRAKDMLENSEFSHEATRSGATMKNIITRLRLRYDRMKENLALGPTNSETIVHAWINSPKHAEVLFAEGQWDAGVYAFEGKFYKHPTVVTALVVAN